MQQALPVSGAGADVATGDDVGGGGDGDVGPTHHPQQQQQQQPPMHPTHPNATSVPLVDHRHMIHPHHMNGYVGAEHQPDPSLEMISNGSNVVAPGPYPHPNGEDELTMYTPPASVGTENEGSAADIEEEPLKLFVGQVCTQV